MLEILGLKGSGVLFASLKTPFAIFKRGSTAENENSKYGYMSHDWPRTGAGSPEDATPRTRARRLSRYFPHCGAQRAGVPAPCTTAAPEGGKHPTALASEAHSMLLL